MTDKKDLENKDLQKDDLELWKNITRDVERMPGKEYQEAPENLASEEERLPAIRERPVLDVSRSDPPKPKGTGIDKRTDERLRRGQMEIEGLLDLHGMTQELARQTLEDYLSNSYEQGRRCILVITGKGRSKTRQENWFDRKPGVLKQNVPGWLAEGRLGEIVLKFYPARAKDGGDGALYVLLRRKRDN